MSERIIRLDAVVPRGGTERMRSAGLSERDEPVTWTGVAA